jgi:phosphate transport system substrate-binding protein
MTLSCRVLIDAPFTTDRGDSLLMPGGDTAVPDPGVVGVRVKNTGGVVIEARDYLLPLTLRFPDRRVVTVNVTESQPLKLQELVPKTPGFGMPGDRITLPKISLAQDSSYELVVKLSGTRSDSKAPEVEGRLRGGRITTEPTDRSTRRDTLMWGGLTACFAAALAVVLLFTDISPFIQRPAGLTCVADELTVAGSTAFGRAAIEVAGSYHAYCSSSAITVHTPGSKAGVDELRAATSDRLRRLALSDGKDTGNTTGLTATKLAVVPFTLVAHKDVPVDTLSLEDVKRIFNGEADTWGKITHDKNDVRPMTMTEVFRSEWK